MKQKIIILALTLAVIALAVILVSRPKYYITNADRYIEELGDYSQLKQSEGNDEANKIFLLNQVVNNTKFKTDKNGDEVLPQREIQRIINSTKEADKANAEKYGVHFKTYVTRTTKMSYEEYEKAINENAKVIVKQKLVVSAIKKKENIKVSNKDIKDFETNYLKTAGISKEDFEKEYGKSFEDIYGKDNIRYEILVQKVQNCLLEKSEKS